MEWEDANDWVAGLTLGGVSGWRLPYISVIDTDNPVDCSVANDFDCRDNELGYMFYKNFGATAGDDVLESGDPEVLDLFVSVVPAIYWSGNVTDPGPVGGNAWAFDFSNGANDGINPLEEAHYVWAVHEGDVGCLTGVCLDPDLDFPVIAETSYSVHEVTQFKLKECATDGVLGKIKCNNVKPKDVETLLCGREASNDEKLALYTPCPIIQILDEGFEGTVADFLFIGVFNFETGQNVCTIEPIGIDLLFTAQVHTKDGGINKIETTIVGEINPYDYAGSAIMNFNEVKKTDTILDGRNCVSKFRTKSLAGEKFGVVDDAVIESGKIKAGKVKDFIPGADIVDEICGIDCEL
jgi:hypothetical protein